VKGHLVQKISWTRNYLSILQNRFVTGGGWSGGGAVTPQPRHWSITVNSGRSRHGGDITTAE